MRIVIEDDEISGIVCAHFKSKGCSIVNVNLGAIEAEADDEAEDPVYIIRATIDLDTDGLPKQESTADRFAMRDR